MKKKRGARAGRTQAAFKTSWDSARTSRCSGPRSWFGRTGMSRLRTEGSGTSWEDCVEETEQDRRVRNVTGMGSLWHTGYSFVRPPCTLNIEMIYMTNNQINQSAWAESSPLQVHPAFGRFGEAIGARHGHGFEIHQLEEKTSYFVFMYDVRDVTSSPSLLVKC